MECGIWAKSMASVFKSTQKKNHTKDNGMRIKGKELASSLIKTELRKNANMRMENSMASALNIVLKQLFNF
jgi:hypothetical protein